LQSERYYLAVRKRDSDPVTAESEAEEAQIKLLDDRL
jgi:hypothetical protein